MKRISPRKAKTLDEIRLLNTDNKSTDNFWILVSENEVTIAEQKNGLVADNIMIIAKSEFNKLISWYDREQKIQPKQ